MVQGAVGKIGRLQNSRRENVVNVQQSSSSKHVPIQIALEVEAAKSLPNSGKLLPSCRRTRCEEARRGKVGGREASLATNLKQS